MRSVGEWKANWSVAFYRGDFALFLLLMLRRYGGDGEVKVSVDASTFGVMRGMGGLQN
jgi:hypothetical protein